MLPHVASYTPDQPDRAEHIGLEHAHGLVELLVEEGLSEPMPGVGAEDLDRTSQGPDALVQAVDAFGFRQV